MVLFLTSQGGVPFDTAMQLGDVELQAFTIMVQEIVSGGRWDFDRGEIILPQT